MSNSKKMWSFILAIVIAITSIVSSSAIIAPEDSISAQEQWMLKIDEILVEKMANASDTDVIPVWVWFVDVDKSNVEAMVKNETGISKNDLSVEKSFGTEDVVSALSIASTHNNDSTSANASHKMQTYLEATKESRAIEKQRTDIYLAAKRRIIGALYENNNGKILNNLDIPNSVVSFQSKLTPSAILYITKDDIVNIAKSNDVVSIDFYDEQVYEEPDLVYNQKDVMQYDAVYEQFGFSGDDVDILQYERSYVNILYDHFSDIEYPENVTVIRDAATHDPSDRDYFSGVVSSIVSDNPYHANIIASVIQDFAQGVHIYSVANEKYSDIEWALLNNDINIDLINASACVSVPTSYDSDPEVKWFDGLVNVHDVAIIASAGNFIEGENGIINTAVLAPACGYNSIGVGAYCTDGTPDQDYMFDFKYGSTDCQYLPTYKPDMVVASGSTSRAAAQVSAIVAMMIELEPDLAAQPEAIKAILMASCHRKVKPCTEDQAAVPGYQETMEEGLTQKQGAGAVDAYRALQIVLQGNYGVKEITSLSQKAASFDLETTDDINVSIAWSRENINHNNQTSLNTEVGTLQELELRIYSNGLMPGESKVANAGKQLAYIKNASPGNYYISVRKKTENAEDVTYGYAWSTKSYMKPELKVTGKTAVGQTLTANLCFADEYDVPQDMISYTWKKLMPNGFWLPISGANEKTYTLTSSDYLYNIKCCVTFSSDALPLQTYHVIELPIPIVKYGDVDFDETVSVMDSTAVSQYLDGDRTFSDVQLYAADVDGDGLVTEADALEIRRYSVGAISSFPVEQNP